MKILGIDPGTTHSGVVLYDSKHGPLDHAIFPNDILIPEVDMWYPNYIVIEMIASYGMPVGASTFDTCVWIGRFVESFHHTAEIRRIYRKQVVVELCGTSRAKDGNVRQALIDRFPPSGGGKVPQIGTKALPGPLYGFKSHLWAALAVAVAGAKLWNELERFPE